MTDRGPHSRTFDYAAAENRNVYRDTEQRMLHDSEFRAVVEQLASVAMARGYTPGELRQIAFAAAVLIESRAVKPIWIHMQEHD